MLALLWAAFAIAAIIYCIVQACKCRFKKAGAVFVGAFVLWVAAAFIVALSKAEREARDAEREARAAAYAAEREARDAARAQAEQQKAEGGRSAQRQSIHATVLDLDGFTPQRLSPAFPAALDCPRQKLA
jgi:mannitol-specific phosphotransferase system IIBC component